MNKVDRLTGIPQLSDIIAVGTKIRMTEKRLY